MPRYAITADIHGQAGKLEAVIQDASRRQVDQFLDLGDVGGDNCHALLQKVQAISIFGNYEVSQWGTLSPENQARVRSWPPIISRETFLAAHATPYFPEPLADVEAVWDYMIEHGVTWQQLFPRLDNDEHARWLTYAEMAERRKRLYFHGHTHVQAIWRIGPSGAMTEIRAAKAHLDRRAFYIVGVGSVGRPQDGHHSRYTVYDQEEQTIQMCAI